MPSIEGFPLGTQPDYLQEFLIPGFSALDEALKTYWAGIRVPTKDSYRLVRVKVAGGDKTVLFWADDLRDGRVRLPVISLNRETAQPNPDKFSPPYLAMRRLFSADRRYQSIVYRPIPFLVEYELTSWSVWKRDADHILYQVMARFNPLAEFTMSDGHIRGNVQLRFGGYSDASEKEAGFDQQAKIRYEFKMTAEAWLPLPERVVPSILGMVNVAQEYTTREILYQVP